MTTAKYVKKARKDFYQDGKRIVKKGEGYWWWQFAFQPRQVSLEEPGKWQLTQSKYLQSIFGVEAMIQALGKLREGFEPEPQVEAIVGFIDEKVKELKEKHGNIPETLKNVTAGAIIQERIDSCLEWKKALLNISFKDKKKGCEQLLKTKYS